MGGVQAFPDIRGERLPGAAGILPGGGQRADDGARRVLVVAEQLEDGRGAEVPVGNLARDTHDGQQDGAGAGLVHARVAHTIVNHTEQGWSLLCNGVVIFGGTGELLPGGAFIAPHRPTDIAAFGRPASMAPGHRRQAPAALSVIGDIWHGRSRGKRQAGPCRSRSPASSSSRATARSSPSTGPKRRSARW